MKYKNESIKKLLTSKNKSDILLAINAMISKDFPYHMFKKYMKLSEPKGAFRSIGNSNFIIINKTKCIAVGDNGAVFIPLTSMKYYKGDVTEIKHEKWERPKKC